MKFKAALFYNGCIAYYNIFLIAENYYKVKLDTYKGEASPPVLIELFKDGYTWCSNCSDHELTKELGAAIEQRLN